MLIRSPPLEPSSPAVQTLSNIFNAFQLLQPHTFRIWRIFPEDSATYGVTSLARAVPYSEWEKAMLKISVSDSARQRRLIVEGKLVAPWAAELRRACEMARADLGGRELIIELKHVTAISHEGENVILELINGGVKFRSGGVFTKHVVKELRRRAKKT